MTPAQFFDGRQPQAYRGSITREGATLTFTRSDVPERYSFSCGNIRSLEKIDRTLHLEFRPRGRRSDALLVECFDAEFLPEIRQGIREAGGMNAFRHLVWNRLPGLFWVLLMLVALPLGHWGYSNGAEQLSGYVPYSWEEELGEQVYGQLSTFWHPIPNHPDLPELQRMVDELAEEEGPFPLQVMVVEMPEVNAFALPGGQILVSSGLLQQIRNKNTWAGILGHEVAHVEERHVMRALTRNAGTLYLFSIGIGGGMEGFEAAEQALELGGILVNLEYSREMEMEADRISVEKLLKNNRDPRGLLQFFEGLQLRGEESPEMMNFLSTHPVHAERIEAIEKMIPENGRYVSW